MLSVLTDRFNYREDVGSVLPLESGRIRPDIDDEVIAGFDRLRDVGCEIQRNRFPDEIRRPLRHILGC